MANLEKLRRFVQDAKARGWDVLAEQFILTAHHPDLFEQVDGQLRVLSEYEARTLIEGWNNATDRGDICVLSVLLYGTPEDREDLVVWLSDEKADIFWNPYNWAQRFYEVSPVDLLLNNPLYVQLPDDQTYLAWLENWLEAQE